MKKLSRIILLKILPIFLFFLILASTFIYYFWDKFYPGVYIGNLNLTALTRQEAQEKLSVQLSEHSQTPLQFTFKNQTFEIYLKNLNITPSLLDRAFSFGHQTLYPSLKFSLTLLPNPNLDNQISQIAQKINQPPQDSTLKFDGKQINVTPSQNGSSLDETTLKSYITTYLNTGILPTTTLPTKPVPPNLSYNDALSIKKTLDQIKLSPIKLNYANQAINLDLPTILGLIDLPSSLNSNGHALENVKLSLNQTRLSQYLKTLSSNINQPLVEPIFNYDQSTNKVTSFSPPQEGRQLDIQSASQTISDHLLSGNLSPITLPVEIIEPKNQLANSFGIKDLLGEGVSHFYGSSSDRIFNLELAASRVNGTLVAPGTVFSFDSSVGDISSSNGYHEGYVIKSGKTVLDDGGGVCQDPTTLFRAVLNAGLPVVARTAHAYRVGYYEEGFPPGLDATIYQPSVDFQFKNDTSAYILVQAHWDNSTDTLYYDLYGTSDNRLTQISTPVILNSTRAPADIHQDDPTQPVGKITQIDFASGGAKVVFSRTVTRNGQTIIHDTYTSNYQPQANVYLVGTKTN